MIRIVVMVKKFLECLALAGHQNIAEFRDHLICLDNFLLQLLVLIHQVSCLLKILLAPRSPEVILVRRIQLNPAAYRVKSRDRLLQR